MQILLTNDDGIYAPGLNALKEVLQQYGDITVVAPATEQSGVSHSITYLSPIICREVYDGDVRRGWAVGGSPADCVKLGVFEYCPERPQLVVSGINGGLNAGINVLYSGTVAAAIEGAFFGITSIAVSLEYDEHANFPKAAQIAGRMIERILQNNDQGGSLYNLNIPTAAIQSPDVPDVRVVPMGLARYGDHFIRRQDPVGRTYFWATTDPPPEKTEHETDITALDDGFITLTPLDYNLTNKAQLSRLREWDF